MRLSHCQDCLSSCWRHIRFRRILRFCGLIAGSLPFIFKKVKGHAVTVGKIIPFLVFFGIVILMAVMGETSGNAADVSFNVN